MQQARKFVLFAAMAAALSLSACDVSTPSNISLSPIRLKDQDATVALDAAHVDADRVTALADDYMEKGRGPMSLVASYPANAGADAVSTARAQGAAWQKAFEKRGIDNVGLTLVPLAPGEPGAGTVVMHYRTLAALPPKNCTRLPGHNGADTMGVVYDYNFGCETQTAVSKMLVDPSDLDGKAGAQESEASRAAKVVEKHKAGTPNEQLKGFSASTVGQAQ